MKKYKHVKTEGEYVLIGIGRMQANHWWEKNPNSGQATFGKFDQAVDMRKVALYRSLKDQSLWVRPIEEFMDGRFIKIGTVDDPLFALWLFREFVMRNATQWRLGSNHHHPMWSVIAELIEGGKFEFMTAKGPHWEFIQPENRKTLEELRNEES